LTGFGGAVAAPAPVSFRAQIAPIFLEQCQNCHGAAEQKGGYRLDTFEFLSRNEDPSDPVLVAGKPEMSRLYTSLVTEESDERMPKKAPPLPSAQAELVKRWIAEGAAFDGADATASLIEILPARTHPKAPEVYAQPLPVTALCFSPDGSELFAGGLRELTVWNPSTGALMRRIGNVAPRTFTIAFAPDGGKLAVAGGAPGEYGEVRLFHPKTGALLSQLSSSTDAVLGIDFSPSGELLATAGADRSLSVFETASGLRRHRLNAHSEAVTAVAFSPDGTKIASVGLDRGAKVFDAATGKLAGIYRGHQAPLYAVAFTPDGHHVLSGGRDKGLHQWDIAEGKKARELVGQGDVLRVLVSGDQTYLVGSAAKLVQAAVADLKLSRNLEGTSDWMYSVAIHPATQRIAAGCYDGTVTVWNLADGKPVTRFCASPGHGQKTASSLFSADGRTVVSLGCEGFGSEERFGVPVMMKIPRGR
jgi:WD40 repeat protein/mono/diheme cytochrome c family protein